MSCVSPLKAGWGTKKELLPCPVFSIISHTVAGFLYFVSCQTRSFDPFFNHTIARSGHVCIIPGFLWRFRFSAVIGIEEVKVKSTTPGLKFPTLVSIPWPACSQLLGGELPYAVSVVAEGEGQSMLGRLWENHSEWQREEVLIQLGEKQHLMKKHVLRVTWVSKLSFPFVAGKLPLLYLLSHTFIWAITF